MSKELDEAAEATYVHGIYDRGVEHMQYHDEDAFRTGARWAIAHSPEVRRLVETLEQISKACWKLDTMKYAARDGEPSEEAYMAKKAIAAFRRSTDAT